MVQAVDLSERRVGQTAQSCNTCHDVATTEIISFSLRPSTGPSDATAPTECRGVWLVALSASTCTQNSISKRLLLKCHQGGGTTPRFRKLCLRRLACSGSIAWKTPPPSLGSDSSGSDAEVVAALPLFDQPFREPLAVGSSVRRHIGELAHQEEQF